MVAIAGLRLGLAANLYGEFVVAEVTAQARHVAVAVAAAGWRRDCAVGGRPPRAKSAAKDPSWVKLTAEEQARLELLMAAEPPPDGPG